MANAADVSENTTDTPSDTQVMKAVDNTQEVSQTNTVTNDKDINNENIRSIDEEKNNKTIDKKINIKNTKEAEANDWNTLNSAIESAKQATTDTTITLQSGTYTTSNTIIWDKNSITLTIDRNGQTIEGNRQQVYNIDNGCSFVLKNTKKGQPNKIKRVYYNKDCYQCQLKYLCTKSEVKIITEYENELTKIIEQRIKTPEAQEEYKKRSHRVEPPFGVLKQQKQLDTVHVTGQEEVKNRITLKAIGYNLKRLENMIKK